MPELHCLVPGLVEAIKLTQVSDASLSNDVVSLLARADVLQHPADYSNTLAQLVLAEPDQQAKLPAASLLSDTPVDSDETWLQAVPVNLLPDRDKLLLKPVNSNYYQSVDRRDLAELSGQFLAHFSDLFSRVQITRDNGWLFQLKSPCAISTSHWRDVLGQHVQMFMPSGDDAARWHGIMNEMQMLLHMHDSERFGFNSFWLEGVGSRAGFYIPKKIAACSDDSLVQAIAKWSGGEPVGNIDDLLEMHKPSDAMVYARPSFIETFFRQSLPELEKLLLKINEELASAVQALNSNRLSAIHVYPFNGQKYLLKKHHRYFFWRKKSI